MVAGRSSHVRERNLRASMLLPTTYCNCGRHEPNPNEPAVSELSERGLRQCGLRTKPGQERKSATHRKAIWGTVAFDSVVRTHVGHLEALNWSRREPWHDAVGLPRTILAKHFVSRSSYMYSYEQRGSEE